MTRITHLVAAATSLTVAANDPRHAGCVASTKKIFFGPWSRFALFPVHTRFEAVSWFVADAMNLDDETGFASIVAQEETPEAAIAAVTWGLTEEDETDVC